MIRGPIGSHEGRLPQTVRGPFDVGMHQAPCGDAATARASRRVPHPIRDQPCRASAGLGRRPAAQKNQKVLPEGFAARAVAHRDVSPGEKSKTWLTRLTGSLLAGRSGECDRAGTRGSMFCTEVRRGRFRSTRRRSACRRIDGNHRQPVNQQAAPREPTRARQPFGVNQ